MPTKASRGIDGVFGSGARARILAYLAQSSDPQTGYAIAKALQLGVSNVYPELKQLERWAILASRSDPNDSRGYFLADEDLRRFLIRRIRILPTAEWFSAESISKRESLAKEAKRLSKRAPRVRAAGTKRPFSDEFRRPPEKDRALQRIKGKASVAP
jgi:DNA-binding transcriptional regulator GbsR (MarR family)